MHIQYDLGWSSSSVSIKMKAVAKFFPLYTTVDYSVQSTGWFYIDEILKGDHPDKMYRAALSCDIFYYVLLCLTLSMKSFL